MPFKKRNKLKLIPNKISRIIYQSWKTDDISTYADGKTGVLSQNRWQTLYPDFKYMLWTDNDIINYITKNKHTETFNRLDGIKKMDFFRYLILYEYGGIYSDMDFITNKRIPNHILEKEFIGYKADRDDIQYTNDYIDDEDGKWVLGQAFFGCNPKHPSIKNLLTDIIETTENIPDSPLLHTGPEKINSIFVKDKTLFDNSTYIFSKQEIGNSESPYGDHLKKHQWGDIQI